ncbi:hypothetical protein EHE19_010660 [Ruminiclostridium herbifermentans]|uniref:Uncharacterized protein n=1 Tax=Ruminiclostridium herbifermentans TaxID=2488810 RepID=A0A4U7JIB9_9FIRM|nr:hypothetical protein [Ruminiclostridium herbifermentans]QNU65399.1 hypothetical protein EHE19_010660 [Ruminiclostridium herbifermentans]
MFSDLFTYDASTKIFFDTLFISIPEVFFWVLFTLILVGEFEYWSESECKRLINKFDYVRVFLPTVVVAFIINISYYFGLSWYLVQFISIVSFYIILVVTNDVFDDASALKWMSRTFLFMILGFIINKILNFLVFSFIMHISKITIEQINRDFLLGFGISLPIRVIQYILLLYFVTKKRTLLKGQWLKHILSSPLLSAIYYVIVLFNVLFLKVIYEAITNYYVLEEMSKNSVFILLIAIILSPVINIVGFMIGCYYVKNKEIEVKNIEAEKLNNLSENIRLYIKNGNYDNILWKLNGVRIEVENIAKGIYDRDKL